ncbi:MAG: cohesin domain-containing protein, partial [Bacteroidota bacterium]
MKGLYTLILGLLLLMCNQLVAQGPLNVTVESGSAAVGQEICLDITGSNFNGILGFQFGIDYDPAVLQFSSSSGQSFFGQPVSIQNSAPGEIRFTWNVFSADELTEVGPFLIAEICFTVLVATETEVTISSQAIPIEFTSSTGSVNDFDLTTGIVNQGMGNQPTCTDGMQNGNETGVDCGGPDCPTCPTCNDGVQNGNETGIDCGGPDCPACPATCSDGIQNGNETGVDCGGPDCPACPTCNDGIQNGNETGIDCGGSCQPCSSITTLAAG